MFVLFNSAIRKDGAMERGIVRFLRQHSIALLALFVALGGTSMAAAQLARNSVGTLQVRNGSLQTIDMSKKARAALKGNRGLRGAQGPAGARGTTGAKGATGAQGPSPSAGSVGATLLKGTYAAVTPGIAAPANTFVNGTATCNAGDRVLGGGFSFQNDDSIVVVYSTPDPLTNPNAWVARARSNSANTFFVWAVCLAA
jgi:hypothetical protein